METKIITTRDNTPSEELSEKTSKNYKGLKLSYTETYYLDFDVDDKTGMIDKTKKAKHYTKSQMDRNLKALKSAYLIEKGAAAPEEIINFRTKYKIAASTLSLILGFSKNTISNIENDGLTSLSSGRLIKICLSNLDLMSHYVKICDAIDKQKKVEISKRLLQQG